MVKHLQKGSRVIRGAGVLTGSGRIGEGRSHKNKGVNPWYILGRNLSRVVKS
jgi:hypothetical protein